MFEQFTDTARISLAHANAAAQRFEHEYLGPEHMMLGLFAARKGLAIRMIEQLGVLPPALKRSIEEQMRSRTREFDPHAIGQSKRAIELAVEAARSAGDKHIGTEHFLLGVLRQDQSQAHRILMGFGITLENVRQQITLVRTAGIVEN